MVNVKEILKTAGIAFVTTGKNISRDHIGMACPFCNKEGNADPSHHLGIHVETGKWSCWRNSAHHGTLPYLLKELLSVSLSEAKERLEFQPAHSTDDFKTKVREKLLPQSDRPLKYLHMPADFIPVNTRTKATNYLIQRGFPLKDHKLLADWYDLRFSTSEPWEDRIVFPIYEYNKLLTWTGRSIYNKTKEKYKNLNNEQSIVSLKDTVWNYDWLCELKKQMLLSNLTIYLCEGPFDALKIDFYSNFNVAAVPIFGLTLADRQLAHLAGLKPDKIKIVLDRDAEMRAIRLKQKLSNLQPQLVKLPKGIKDPGSFPAQQIRDFFT